MIANRINKNHELAQLEHIRKARENLRIALEAEWAVKKAEKKEAIKAFLEGLIVAVLCAACFIMAGAL